MITIFLSVNIQYLLHFQIDLFLIYFAVITIPLINNTSINAQVPIREICVRQRPAGGAASLRIHNLTSISIFYSFFFKFSLHGVKVRTG